MASWWYLEGEDKIGPFDDNVFKEIISNKPLLLNTLVWTSGYENWKELGEISELKYFLSQEVPPPPPTAKLKEEDEVSHLSLNKVGGDSYNHAKGYHPQAGRWRRFFARLFDTLTLTTVVSLVGGYVMSGMFEGFYSWIIKPGSESIFGLVCLPVALLIDGFIYKVFKNTLGKYLLGLSVVDDNYKRISADDYLGRNFALWKGAYAFGIPLVSLITLFCQYDDVKKTGKTSYDKKLGWSVVVRKGGFVRSSAFIILFAVLIMIVMVIRVMDKQRESNDYSAHANKIESKEDNNVWANPVTNTMLSLDGGWGVNTQIVEGRPTSTFYNNSLDVALILAYENTDYKDYTFSNYVSAVTQVMSKDFTPPKNGEFSTSYSEPSWVGSGKLKGKPYDYSMEIYKKGGQTWRVIAVYKASDAYNSKIYSFKYKIIDTFK